MSAPAAAVDHVDDAATEQAVVRRAAAQRVAGEAADSVLHIDVHVVSLVARPVIGHVVQAHRHRRGALGVARGIDARPADEAVVAVQHRLGHGEVVARSTVERIVAGAQADHVIARTGRHPVVAAQRNDDVPAAGAGERVPPLAADDRRRAPGARLLGIRACRPPEQDGEREEAQD